MYLIGRHKSTSGSERNWLSLGKPDVVIRFDILTP